MQAKLIRRLTIATTAALLAATIGFQAASAAETNVVLMKNFDFSPMTLSIPPGTTVTWKNLDAEPHTVVSDSGMFRSGGLDQNDSFAFKFDKPGTYRFLCSIHPTMMGTIVVR